MGLHMTELQELVETCKEILRWVKFSNIGRVKEVLETVLNTPQKKIAYHLSDGIRNRSEIGKLAAVHGSTVNKWWLSWYKFGIAKPTSVRGGNRGAKVFDLSDFAIVIPRIPFKPVQQGKVESNE